MTYHVNHFINGKSVTSSDKNLDLVNPATGLTIGTVGIANQTIINDAVNAAKKAFTTWGLLPPMKRARIFFQYKTILENNIDTLAKSVTAEHGKTFNDARASVQRGIDLVEFVCGLPYLLKGSYAENVATDIDSYSIRQPLGVCAGITPFNFPAMIPLWMFPMSLVCGNTFILKPSEKDPSCSLKLVELAQEAGLPDGVLNVVHGDKTVVESLLQHPDIKAISFVGSTPVAEHVYKTATANGKRAQTFGGAKNHCVVMPDADLEQTADALVGAAYGSAGERCMAISAVVAVGDDVADALVEKLIPRVKNLKIGEGFQDVEMGPLISKAHLEKVTSYIDTGIKEGAKLVVDGRGHSVKDFQEGNFLAGSLFDNVKANMKIYREEIFGPVLVILRVKTLDEAIELVDNHEFGNGTAIFTNDGYAARTFASRVQVGMIGINIPIPVPVAYQSFGGWKRSLFGDMNMHGIEGMQFFTRIKTITQRWPKHEIMQAEFTIPTMK